MAFHVGQKVECVKGYVPNVPGTVAISEGEIYTIREISYGGGMEDEIGLRLVGVVNSYNFFFDEEWAYSSTRFRPLQEQGMSILRAILADPEIKIKETA